MKATETLMSEHRVIERVLNSLSTAADRLEAGEQVKPEFFLEATDFIKGFADGCHHKKEEGVLFTSMADCGIPVRGGPIGVMLSEHEAGRQYTSALRSAALDMQAGDPQAFQRAIQSARGYVALLRQHIYKEDFILFPLADKVIPAEQQSSVMEGFEHVEHEETGEGIHEKYLALADKLEKEVS